MDALAAQVSKVSFDGASAGTATLDVKVAKPDVAKGLVHKYVVMVRQNARRGTASTLTKSEVRGGGRKPFKQKGTGRARQGTTRAAQMRGGGVVFGPHNRDHSHKMPKKVRRAALKSALSRRVEEKAMTVFDAFEMEAIKTKDFKAVMDNFGFDSLLLVLVRSLGIRKFIGDHRQFFTGGRDTQFRLLDLGNGTRVLLRIQVA